MTAITEVEQVAPSKLFFVEDDNSQLNDKGLLVLPLVPVDPSHTSIVFQTRTGKLWAYIENDELIVISWEGPFGVVIMPDGDSSVRIIAETATS